MVREGGRERLGGGSRGAAANEVARGAWVHEERPAAGFCIAGGSVLDHGLRDGRMCW